MGKVNVCLKRSYIIVISLIAMLGALLLAFTLFSHGHFYKEDEIESMLPGLHVMYVLSIITLILTIIGLYGACKEKKWALIMFAVGMILGSLFWITCEIQGLAERPKVTEHLKREYLKLLPLNNASEVVTNNLKAAQIEFQCCGLDQGYLDWGYNIPESCLCTKEPTNPCVAAPRNSSLSEHLVDDQHIMIYKESCLPYIIDHVMMIIDSAMGIILGVTLLWVLSVVLCILILCRLNKKEDIPVVVYSPEAKAGNYSPLTDSVENA
ncbi:tetraspanin-8-like isoform X1 [Anoplopoma fimbria]|uniref:tetraspanin-8-like isoform X1 n=1 Tax=Anoplopoma fimbria TaxID=229290 RepID=UPI0023EBCCA7|nr:tetraspanin-8-like isoform X1 [Anoplopoma fimbria]